MTSAPTIEITRVDAADDEVVTALAALVPQMSSSAPPVTRQWLEVVVASESSTVFVARVDGAIVGTTTLVLYPIPVGRKAWIEDVVVDSGARGLGVGELLVRTALAEAARSDAKDVMLTSRATREAANRLYQRLGFERRETNLYRYTL